MTEIEISDSFPIPVGRSCNSSTGLRQAVLKLEVGQSFFYPKRSSAGVQVANIKQLHPDRDFTTRKVTENEVEGVRVWRIK